MKIDEVEKDPIKLILRKIREYAEQRYGKSIGSGRNRIAFQKGNTIIKVPLNFDGISDNEYEYKTYEDAKLNPKLYGEIKFAKAKLLHTSDGVPILFMEKLNTESSFNEHPKWADCIDCGQVGKDKQGNWKAYDYGRN